MSDSGSGVERRLASLPRDHGKALKRTAGAVLAILILLAGGTLVARTSLFAIDSIEVVGAGGLVSNEEVLGAARVQTGTPAVSVEENAIAARVEAVPGVETAQVRTHWPSKVTISVTERVLVVVARTSDDRWASVSADGVVVRVNDQPESGLPSAVGATVSGTLGDPVDQATLAVIDVAKALPASLKPEVVQVQRDEENGIRLGLRSGVIVLVGSDELLADKLTAAASVLRQVDQAAIASLDVRSPSLPVTNPKESANPNPQPTTPSGDIATVDESED